MDITIHRGFDASMAEQLLQNFGLHARFPVHLHILRSKDHLFFGRYPCRILYLSGFYPFFNSFLKKREKEPMQHFVLYRIGSSFAIVLVK
jgi:hypothetical protein